MSSINILYKNLKKKYPICGVPAIIINDKGEILLGKRSDKVTFYVGYWGLPGGILEYGEKMEDAVKREIKEELGAEAEVVKVGKPYESLPSKECKRHGIDVPHYCKLKGKLSAKDETEEIKWFKPKEIRKMNLAYIHKEILRKEGLI